MELEPSLKGKTYRVFHSRSGIPITVTFERQSTDELMDLRVLMSGDLSNPIEIKIELTTENDLFFCYHMTCSEQTYISLSLDNQINITFEQFPLLLKNLISDVGSQKGGMKYSA